MRFRGTVGNASLEEPLRAVEAVMMRCAWSMRLAATTATLIPRYDGDAVRERGGGARGGESHVTDGGGGMVETVMRCP